MIIASCLTLGLMAWISFIYVQYHFGDRPVSTAWYAVMMGLGTFEYTKGILGLIEYGTPALPLAFGVALVTAAAVLGYKSFQHAEPSVAPLDQVLGLTSPEAVAVKAG